MSVPKGGVAKLDFPKNDFLAVHELDQGGPWTKKGLRVKIYQQGDHGPVSKPHGFLVPI